MSETSSHRENLKLQLSDLLFKVDKSLVSRRQKLKLYSLAICSRLSYPLSLFSLLLSWLERSLDSLVTRYLKKWSGLARSANSARLYLSTKAGGLDI